MKLSKNQQLSTLLFADDQVVIADMEDNLQKAAHKLDQIITEYGLTISVQKTKSMAFKGRDPVRTKIVIDNKIIEQVKMFNLLKPNDIYICRTAAPTSRRYILNIYSTNIHTEYFKHAA